MGWFRGIWIGSVRNDIVRAAVTIAFSATDMICEGVFDSYFGQQNSVKVISSRLLFEQYIFITVDLLFLKRWVFAMISIDAYLIRLQGYRSIPIAQRNRFARVSDRHPQNATDVKNLFSSGQIGILVYDWVCSTIFSVQRGHIIIFFP